MEPTCEAKARPERRVMPVVQIDGRTRLGLRLSELKRLYASALGGWEGLSPLMRERVEEAARLKALAEVAQRRYADRERGVTLIGVTRAARLALSAERRLGIEGRGDKTQGPSLAKYLNAKGGAK